MRLSPRRVQLGRVRRLCIERSDRRDGQSAGRGRAEAYSHVGGSAECGALPATAATLQPSHVACAMDRLPSETVEAHAQIVFCARPPQVFKADVVNGDYFSGMAPGARLWLAQLRALSWVFFAWGVLVSPAIVFYVLAQNEYQARILLSSL